jgi:hypothetical protein
MNSIVEYSNSLSLTTDSHDDLVQDALTVFEEKLKNFKPRTIKKVHNRLFYTAGVMRLVFNSNLLYGISEGEINIEKKEQTLIVHYVIRFYELLALSVIPAVGALVIMDSILEKVIGISLVITVSYGANVLITILRYKRFIKTTVTAWLNEKKPVTIGEEQQEWITNLNKCDACGHVISDTDINCPDCGLSLR